MPELELQKIKKILFIMMGGIGNMIFLTPALQAIRKTLPHARMTFLLGPYGAEQVIEKSTLFDDKVIVDPEAFKVIRGSLKLIRYLRKEEFDLSFTSTGTNPIKSGILCWLAGIKYRLGENINHKGFLYNIKIPFDPSLHEVESNNRLAEKLGLVIDKEKIFIHTSEEDDRFAENFLATNNLKGRLVFGMHPGSGIHQAGFKRWPKEKFAQLADWLIDRYSCSVIFFGGTEEVELVKSISQLMQKQPILMAGKTTLAQSAALIKKCKLFISNDSGLLHVACALATPTIISIFGPTDYRKTGPYSGSSLMIRKDLHCSPCYSGKPIRCPHFDCIHLISVDDVKDTVLRSIE